MFHLICFIQSTFHCSCFIFMSFSPKSISFISSTIVHLVHIYLIWLHSYYMVTLLSVSLFSQSHLWNDLWVSLDKFSILDRYSLLEAELRWFYYSLSLYIKQEIQHGIRRNVLACLGSDVYLLIYLTQAYVGKRWKYVYFSYSWIS